MLLVSIHNVAKVLYPTRVEIIVRGRESNFKKRSPSDLVSGPYDYASIMHYERKAFSKNGQETIRPLVSG